MFLFHCYYIIDRTCIDEKNIPEPSSIMKFYEAAYEHGWDKLEDGTEELIWFLSKVMPAVQKHWKPFRARGNKNAKIAKYYDSVTASDEAFGLFLLKYYADQQSLSKKPGVKNKHQQGELKVKKEKLSGKKLWDAMLDYDKWYRQFNNLHKVIEPQRSILARDIEEHCYWEMQNKNKDKQGKTVYYMNTDVLKLAMTALPMV